MALKKIMQIEGDAYINTPAGPVSIGNQKTAFDAYCKIITMVTDKAIGRVTVQCSADQYSVTKSFDVPVSVEEGAPNFFKQAYLHLKTLPEWADASDC